MDRKRRAIIIAVLLISAVLFCACQKERVPLSPEPEAAGLTVAVTIVPEETFVKAVAGDLADVVTMIPPGYSPENYEPTVSEIEHFQDSTLYFAIGLPVEETAIFPQAPETLRIVSLADAAREVYPERTFADGERDPHIWLSPKRVIVMIETIAEGYPLPIRKIVRSTKKTRRPLSTNFRRSTGNWFPSLPESQTVPL